MILPCRIPQRLKCVDSLTLALLFAASFMIPTQVMGQEAPTSPFEESGIGWFPAIPIQITAGLDMGYDDNATLTPNAEGSLFLGENVTLTYDRPAERTQVYMLGIGRFDQYFDVSRNDVDGNVTMSL